MFKVLIIDDEPIIRKGLKNIVNWRQFDCAVCGEASDGSQGSRLIKELAPDIIITDIRMPEVDGLSMIREIKDLVPRCKIIMLTGFRNFDYVQEAIKLGAFDFILKPTKIEELTSVIARAVKELKFQKDRTEEIDKIKVLFEQNMPILREKLLNDIIHEINTNEEEILAKMELFNVTINKFVMVEVENEYCCDGGETKVSQYDRHLYQFGIINTFEEVFTDTFSVMSIKLDEIGVAFILQPLDEHTDANEAINKKCVYLQEIIRNCFGFTVTIAVSSAGAGAMQLPSKHRECREALEHKFYMGNDSIIFHNDLNTFFKYEEYSMLEKYKKSLLEGVKTGNESIVKSRLGDIFSFIKGLEQVNKDYLRNFYWSTITSINNIRVLIAAADSEKKSEVRELTGLHSLMEKSSSIAELNGILEEIALSVALRVNSYNNKSIKLVLRKAVEYIKLHYSEQVTLNEVAEHAYVSTYYISRMFKKEMGKNFVDYLNEIRLEKAKELLSEARYKTYEVAEMVGIPDAHYFSRLFKKVEGITPTEYRDLHT